MIKKVFTIIIIMVLAVAAYIVLRDLPSPSDETFEVSRIIDGDTIELSNGDRVRLIGINTPETGQPYYNEATEKLRELIGTSTVTLKKDVDDKDRYGRLLRYIYVNDTFVNLEMVREGYAIAYDYELNVKYSDEFHEAEQEAREARLGIWTRSEFTLTISLLHADAEGDDNQNLNDEYVVFENNGNTTLILKDWTVQDEANNYYVFPEYGLVNGTSVTLYTGSGSDGSTELYWGSSNPIWNNDGDTLYLRDADGFLVNYYSY